MDLAYYIIVEQGSFKVRVLATVMEGGPGRFFLEKRYYKMVRGCYCYKPPIMSMLLLIDLYPVISLSKKELPPPLSFLSLSKLVLLLLKNTNTSEMLIKRKEKFSITSYALRLFSVLLE